MINKRLVIYVNTHCCHAISFIPAAKNETCFCIIHPAEQKRPITEAKKLSFKQSEN